MLIMLHTLQHGARIVCFSVLTFNKSGSSIGRGRCPFKAERRVRFPYRAPNNLSLVHVGRTLVSKTRERGSSPWGEAILLSVNLSQMTDIT